MGNEKYIGGSIINTLGLIISVIGIIMVISDFVYHQIVDLVVGVVLIILGIIISIIGRYYKYGDLNR